MGITHISIYSGKAQQVEAKTSAPTDRENAEYEVGTTVGLEDGDWYFNTTSKVLAIRLGGNWNFISFTATP